MKGTNTLMEFAAVDPLAHRKMKNLTPHPVKVLAYPRCWYGDPATDEELEASDWVREFLNDGREVTGGYLTIPTEVSCEGELPSPLRLTEQDDAAERGITIGVGFSIDTNGMDIETGVVTRSYSPPSALPEEEPGMTLIVSLPFLMGLAVAGVARDDLVAPDTGPSALRDAQGRIEAVRGFVRLKPSAAATDLLDAVETLGALGSIGEYQVRGSEGRRAATAAAKLRTFFAGRGTASE